MYDNVLINCRVGLDNSAATNAVWANNYVRATIASDNNGPAFRSITYEGLPPINVSVFSNYLENGAGGDHAVKVDDRPWNGTTNVNFVGNTMAYLYIVGQGVNITKNTFLASATIYCDFASLLQTRDIFINTNYWNGNLSIVLPTDTSFCADIHLANQVVNGTGSSIQNPFCLIVDNVTIIDTPTGQFTTSTASVSATSSTTSLTTNSITTSRANSGHSTSTSASALPSTSSLASTAQITTITSSFVNSAGKLAFASLISVVLIGLLVHL